MVWPNRWLVEKVLIKLNKIFRGIQFDRGTFRQNKVVEKHLETEAASQRCSWEKKKKKYG